MDIGRDNGLVVDRAYEDKAPYVFTGTVKQVVFDLKPATTRGREACTSTRQSTLSPKAPPDKRAQEDDRAEADT